MRTGSGSIWIWKGRTMIEQEEDEVFVDYLPLFATNLRISSLSFKRCESEGSGILSSLRNARTPRVEKKPSSRKERVFLICLPLSPSRPHTCSPAKRASYTVELQSIVLKPSRPPIRPISRSSDNSNRKSIGFLLFNFNLSTPLPSEEAVLQLNYTRD